MSVEQDKAANRLVQCGHGRRPQPVNCGLQRHVEPFDRARDIVRSDRGHLRCDRLCPLIRVGPCGDQRGEAERRQSRLS